MPPRKPRARRVRALATVVAAVALSLITPSCATIGAHKLDQVYYLGIFDPHEQLPPSFYRIRVTGRSSFFSNINYAAGWVPAPFIDSLNTQVSFDNETGSLDFKDGETSRQVTLETGRGLMLFGPEGFRPAPRDHRLAVVMSGDPSKFFDSIQEAMGQLSAAKHIEKSSPSGVRTTALEAFMAANQEEDAITQLMERIQPTEGTNR